MYKLIYYNTNENKYFEYHEVEFDNLEMAMTQYQLLKDKYQQVVILDAFNEDDTILTSNTTEIINKFLIKNEKKLKKQFKNTDDKMITRKDLINIEDEGLKKEINVLLKKFKIDIDKLAFEIECHIYG